MSTDVNPKPGILRNLRVKRVDLVDMGANFDTHTGDGAHIMLFKRDPTAKDGPGSPLPSSAMGAVHVDTPTCKCADCMSKAKKEPLVSKSKSTVTSLITKMLSLFGETDVAKRDAAIAVLTAEAVEIEKALPPGAPGAGTPPPAAPAASAAAAPPAASGGMPPEHVNALKAHYDALCKMINSYGAGAPPAPGAAPAAAPPAHQAMKAARIEVGKALTEAGYTVTDDGVSAEPTHAPATPKQVDKMDDVVAKRMTDLEKRATDAEAAVLVEKNLRLDREMTDILKGFKHTPLNLATDVAEFRKMKESNPAAFDRTIAIMKAQDAQLTESALYKNVGSSMPGSGGGAWEQIEAKADTMVEKSTNGMTKEQALEKVMLSNPKLVAQYRAEQQ